MAGSQAPPTAPHAATLDASFVIGLCAREPGKYAKAQAELGRRIAAGCSLHAPHLLIMEACHVLCKKQDAGETTPQEHAAALVSLQTLSSLIIFPLRGDAQLLARAEQMRGGYGCSRSADSFYLALAEQLAACGSSELLTFDAGQQRQAAAVAPGVTVTLLTA
jgi:predicted nucleic acid-binding protein